MSEPQRYPTNDELDYERRKAAGFPGLGIPGNQSKGVVTELQTQFAVEGNDTSAYVGVTSDRMTYANETERPLSADDGIEKDREERLLKQEFLVAPSTPTPEGNQTGGGGSTQENVVTALAGEKLSSEIANPPKEVKSSESDVATTPRETVDPDAKVSEPAGGSGTTVSDEVKEEQTVSPAASSSVAEAGVVEAETPKEEPTPAPTPAKKASSVRTPSSNS